RGPVILAIAVAAAVPFIPVAELIVTPIIEAAAPACVTPTVLESFLVAIRVGTPLEVDSVASVRISAPVPVGCRARLSGKEQAGHQHVPWQMVECSHDQESPFAVHRGSRVVPG